MQSTLLDISHIGNGHLSCVAFIILFCKEHFRKKSTSMSFCDSSSVSVSLLDHADDTLWRFKLSGQFRPEHIV